MARFTVLVACLVALSMVSLSNGLYCSGIMVINKNMSASMTAVFAAEDSRRAVWNPTWDVSSADDSGVPTFSLEFTQTVFSSLYPLRWSIFDEAGFASYMNHDSGNGEPLYSQLATICLPPITNCTFVAPKAGRYYSTLSKNDIRPSVVSASMMCKMVN